MKSNYPEISVLITNYNKAKFIFKSLECLKKQNFKNFEIIFFDDCSKDNSLEVLKRFKNINPANTLVQANIVGEDYLVEIEAEAIIE